MCALSNPRYDDGGKALQIWLADDLPGPLNGCRVRWTVEVEGKKVLQGEKQIDAKPLGAKLVETVDLSPIPDSTAAMTVSLALFDSSGRELSRDRRETFLKAWRIHEAVMGKAGKPK